MPTISFGSGPGKNLGFAGGSSLPPEFSFPANTIIPYYGLDTDPGLTGWTKYAGFNTGQALMYGSPTFNSLGSLIYATEPIINFSGSLGTAVAHTGTNVYDRIYSTGSIYANNLASGAHTHSVTGYANMTPSSVSTRIYNRQNITYLIATGSRSTIPANTLIINQTAVPNSVAFTQPESTFLVANTVNSIGYVAKQDSSITFTANANFAMAGYHNHSGTSTGQLIPTGQRFYSYYLGDTAGGHTHTPSKPSTFTQTRIAHKLVNLWKLTAESRAKNGMIVMYVGTQAALPSTWVLCNGLNGTPNLGNHVIGYSDGTKWDTVVPHDATTTPSSSLPSAYLPHAHNSRGYYPTNLSASSYPGIISNGQHANYGWSHTHTNNVAASAQAYAPFRLNVAFIQYKG